MLFANITSFIGQCSEAEHYYCHYYEAEPGEKITKQYYGAGWCDDELTRLVTKQNEIDFLNRKDNGDFRAIPSFRYRAGMETNRFNSIEEIHQTLIEKFGDQTIVTYDNSHIFKDMLYYVDGKNLTYKAFGDVWETVPISCWKDLLPELDTIIIKCDDCGHEYKLEDVSYDQYYSIEKRTLVKFYKKWEMDERCCKYFDLMWNVIL